jgi:hypothetical protein
MDAKIAGKWVAALRSGDYVQARGTLRGPAEDDAGAVGYCCLGVLCDLHREFIESQVGPGHAEWVPTAEMKSVGVARIMAYRSGSYQAEGVLPGPVKEWAGLDSINPCASGCGYLSELNDGCHSFAHIADIIEGKVDSL